MSINIMLVDDHQILREGLRALIARQEGLEIVAEAGDGLEALSLAAKHQPDLAIVDVSMANLNGVEATHRMLRKSPDLKIIALSMHSDRRFVEGMFKAGASGYLLKDCAFAELIRAIDLVIEGQTYLSPRLADVDIPELSGSNKDVSRSRHRSLTRREREVLQLIAEGNPTKSIAASRNISVKTVETHRQHIMEKLGINNLPGLTKYAIREGFTTLES